MPARRNPCGCAVAPGCAPSWTPPAHPGPTAQIPRQGARSFGTVPVRLGRGAAGCGPPVGIASDAIGRNGHGPLRRLSEQSGRVGGVRAVAARQPIDGPARAAHNRSTPPALLRGLIVTETGVAMIAHHSKKGTRPSRPRVSTENRAFDAAARNAAGPSPRCTRVADPTDIGQFGPVRPERLGVLQHNMDAAVLRSGPQRARGGRLAAVDARAHPPRYSAAI